MQCLKLCCLKTMGYIDPMLHLVDGHFHNKGLNEVLLPQTMSDITPIYLNLSGDGLSGDYSFVARP